MILFFWILFSLGVAYGAKISGRNAGIWFLASMVLTPLLCSLALIGANRWRMPSPSPRGARRGHRI